MARQGQEHQQEPCHCLSPTSCTRGWPCISSCITGGLFLSPVMWAVSVFCLLFNQHQPYQCITSCVTSDLLLSSARQTQQQPCPCNSPRSCTKEEPCNSHCMQLSYRVQSGAILHTAARAHFCMVNNRCVCTGYIWLVLRVQQLALPVWVMSLSAVQCYVLQLNCTNAPAACASELWSVRSVNSSIQYFVLSSSEWKQSCNWFHEVKYTIKKMIVQVPDKKKWLCRWLVQTQLVNKKMLQRKQMIQKRTSWQTCLLSELVFADFHCINHHCVWVSQLGFSRLVLYRCSSLFDFVLSGQVVQYACKRPFPCTALNCTFPDPLCHVYDKPLISSSHSCVPCTDASLYDGSQHEYMVFSATPCFHAKHALVLPV